MRPRFFLPLLRRFPRSGSVALLLGTLVGCQQRAPHEAVAMRPNILIIYADDLGYGDVSANGQGKIATPNIDALAKSGVRFTNGCATSATCTPSRFALLTGTYPLYDCTAFR